MSVTGCTIQNVSAGMYVDVWGASTAPGTNIIICTLNTPFTGTGNQNWRFIPLDSDENLYKIQNIFTGRYASVESPAANQTLKTSPTSRAWQVTIVNNGNSNYIIKLPNTDLVWSVPAGSPIHTDITLTAQNGAANQQWKLTNI